MRNQYRQGEHLCVVYETEAEQLAVAAEYLGDALRSGERAFYVAESDAALIRFHSALAQLGMSAHSAMARGALIEATHATAHLAHGSFNSERMLVLLNRAVESALNEGFSGLRTCGDMSFLLAEPAGVEQVVEYESQLNQFFRSVRAAGMCQYDRRRLPDTWLHHALHTHPLVVIGAKRVANEFFDVPIQAELDLTAKLDRLRQL